MIQVLENLRDRIIQRISAAESLTANLSTGSRIVKVREARKFDTGQDVVVRNHELGEGFTVERIVDKNTIELDHDAAHDWRVADEAQLNKAFGHNYLKYVMLGDQEVIPSYPSITLEGDNKTIDWISIPNTTDEFTVTISVYVLEDNTEESYKLLLKYTSAIEEMLMNDLHPDISALDQDLTNDIAYGDTLVTVPDATVWNPDEVIVFDSISNRDVNEVKRIVDTTTLELRRGSHFNFSASDDLVAKKLLRYFYDSRVTNITYGYVQKGSSFLKASQLSWFIKEERTRLQPCQWLDRPGFLPT